MRHWAGQVRTHLFTLLCALSLASTVLAQSATDGAIAGRLLTADGNPSPYTQVLAFDPDSGVIQRTTTGRNGDFAIPRLPPGDYILAIADSAVAIPLDGHYAVHLGELTEVEAHIGASAQGESLPAPPIRELTQLPVLPGDWTSLALASAPSTSVADTTGSTQITLGGISPVQNSTRTDGVAADDSFSGTPADIAAAADPETGADQIDERSAGPGSGSRSLAGDGHRTGSSYSFAQSAVREFRVRGQADAAQYGSALYSHGAGGIITSVSRSGTTRLHGMAAYDVRNSAWAASNPFATATSYLNGTVSNTRVKPVDVQQQFAARITGPIMTHSSDVSGGDIVSRLSYLYAFERRLRNYPAVSSPALPSFFTLTATQSALLANRGVSADAMRTALNYLGSLTGAVPRRADQTVNFVRLDWLRPASTRGVLEYNRARWSNPGGTHSAAVVNRGMASYGSNYGSLDALIARILLFPTAHLTNELRLQYSHELRYDAPQQPLAQEPTIAPGGFSPQVLIGPDGFLFGTPATVGRNAYPDERRLEAADVLAVVHGHHILQLGADFSALRDFTSSITNAEGTFTYDSGTTSGHAGGLVDWITDFTYGVNSYPNGACPSIYSAKHYFCFRSYSQSFGQQNLTWQTHEWAGFLQDDWRAAPSLTMHAGVRYDYELLPMPQQPNARLDALFGATAASGIFPEDRNNVGPRIGLAWQPFGRGHGTVRLGYGAYFGKVPGATIRAALLDTALPASTTRIRITPTTETICPQQPTVGFGYPCSFVAPPAGVIGQTTSAMMFSRRFRLPAVQQGTFAVDHSLGWGVFGSASYVLNLDRQLPGSVDLNIAPASGVAGFQLVGGTGKPGARDREVFYVPVYTQRLTPSFGPVTAILSNANATYNALTVEAQRGLGGRAGLGGTGRGLEFHLAWTWSKAIDFAPETGAAPRGNGQFDPFDNRYDKAPSALNVPHRIVATAVWSPRISSLIDTKIRAVRAFLDGWALAGVFTESSGRGYSYMTFGGSRLPGGHESINGAGGSTVLPTAGRNTLRLPDTADLDLRLNRTFRFGERLRAHASADAFNVVNHVNYSGVIQRAYIAGTPGTLGAPAGITPLVFQDAATIASEGLNTLPFGALTDSGVGTAAERHIQLGVRFEF